MSILVLGATGFVGKNVCKFLNERNVNFAKASLSDGMDLKDNGQIKKLLNKVKPSVILNFAANTGGLNYVTAKSADVISDNAKMVLSLYESVADVCPDAIVLNPIGSCTYPGHLAIFNERDWHNGEVHRSVLSYGSARRFTYAVSECYKLQYNIKTISLIVNNMYGPFESTDPNKAHALSALVGKFVKACMEDQSSVEVWGTGAAVREWLYIKDFAKVIYEIINEPPKYAEIAPFNIGQGYGLSVSELVDIISKEVDYQGRIIYDETKPDGAPIKIMSDEKFGQIFLNFEFTSLSDGINETIDYYKSIYPY
jgi:GDP-L-fucose synthase